MRHSTYKKKPSKKTSLPRRRRRVGAMPVLKGDDTKERAPLSEYELARADNIKRNERLLVALGLDHDVTTASAAPSRSSAAGAKRREKAASAERSVRTRTSREVTASGEGRQAAVNDRPSTAAHGERASEAGAGAPNRRHPAQSASETRGGPQPRPLLLADSARAAGSSGGFALRVLKVVNAIPRGKVASYGQCAAYAGSPNSARQVGRLLALGLAAGGHDVPWQRVINASGGISLPPDSGGMRQRQLLQAEGVIFGPTSKVEGHFFWDPSEKSIARLFD